MQAGCIDIAGGIVDATTEGGQKLLEELQKRPETTAAVGSKDAVEVKSTHSYE